MNIALALVLLAAFVGWVLWDLAYRWRLKLLHQEIATLKAQIKAEKKASKAPPSDGTPYKTSWEHLFEDKPQ